MRIEVTQAHIDAGKRDAMHQVPRGLGDQGSIGRQAT